MKMTTRQLVESAIMIAIGTVLSFITIASPWKLGGGITVCSMLPLVILAFRHGTKIGVFASCVYGLIQMIIGFSNVQYASNFMMAVGIVLFDYIVAFGVVGFSAIFTPFFKKRLPAILTGVLFTFVLRLACHFMTGVWIWEALWPNELGWASSLWSLAYNASYMIPEIVLTSIVIIASYKPLEKFWLDQK
ncbi:MAG: energy-coupled thiamine transporter ThiT [Clostridia bacterium]|nr:energy-coupled thiamine transporter ThiT [Clostridia bacterium]MBQ4619677.1 energy-coupled thiamine transporter ThiT [Clostridia bacterium]